jgi:hypothetical protein
VEDRGLALRRTGLLDHGGRFSQDALEEILATGQVRDRNAREGDSIFTRSRDHQSESARCP